MKIGVLKGNGIGPEITAAAIQVIDACGLDIEWVNIPIAEEAIEKFGHPVPNESIQMLKDVKVAIKGPITVEKGKGRVTCIDENGAEHVYPSFNNAIRRELELFVCPRPSRGIPGISGSRRALQPRRAALPPILSSVSRACARSPVLGRGPAGRWRPRTRASGPHSPGRQGPGRSTRPGRACPRCTGG